jgi:hypothetical protein
VAAGATPGALALAAVGAAEDEGAGTAAGTADAVAAGGDGDVVAEGAAGSLKFAPDRLAM